MELSDYMRMPTDARGTGWDGFRANVTDSSLPKSSRDVLRLIDFLFPVADGQPTFTYHYYDKTGNGNGIHQCVSMIKKKEGVHEEGLQWHEPHKPLVPSTKDDLASYVAFILRQPNSPEIANDILALKPKPKRRRKITKMQIRDTGKIAESLPPKINLPASARGSGWEGFNKHVSDECLPKKLHEVLLLIDLFFPVAEGEPTFTFFYYTKDKRASGKAGRELHNKLSELKRKNPSVKGLLWHRSNQPFAPNTKEDLASFIELIINLKKSPKLLQEKQYGKEKKIIAHSRKCLAACTTPSSNRLSQACSSKKTVKLESSDVASLDATTTGHAADLLRLKKSMGLPDAAWGKGWRGFMKYVGYRFPTELRDVFLLVDIFFPSVLSDEEAFVIRAYDNGDSRQRVCELLNEEDAKGNERLSWHSPGSPYVPETKVDLKSFMLLLMDIGQKLTRKGRPKRAIPWGNVPPASMYTLLEPNVNLVEPHTPSVSSYATIDEQEKN